VSIVIQERFDMREIEVSVVIPVYNNKEGVLKAINSILNQEDFNNYEIIVVDDGSKDDTYEALLDFVERQNKKDVIKVSKQHNQGPAAARNNGIKNARGKYIAFLDSDDSWYKDKMKVQMNLFKKDKDLKLVSSTYNNNRFNNLKEIHILDLKMMLFRNYIYTSTVVVDKKALEEAELFNQKQKYSEDYDLWLRLVGKYKCAVINKSLVQYGEGKISFGTGLSSKLWLMEKGELANYRRLYEKNKIGFIDLTAASSFSFSKYLLRRIIVFGRKLKK
jgi:glycosyltransferase involved in cell wall biosynthesis